VDAITAGLEARQPITLIGSVMEGDPHQLVEGAIISAFAIQASVAYIFLRAEYTLVGRLLQRAIDEARANGYLGKNILGSGFDLERWRGPETSATKIVSEDGAPTVRIRK
jgi:hypothetical protein